MTTESRATETVVSSATTSQLTSTPTNPPPPEDTDGQLAIINSENQAGLGMGSIVGIAVWCLCFRRRGTVGKTQLQRGEGVSREYMISPPRGHRSDTFHLDQSKAEGNRLSELTTARPTVELEDKYYTSKSGVGPETYGRAELYAG
ncbi:hypothetical protein MCOR11_006225 [Pyricularia oryzae]|nr:hypothetical protein MCOR01_000315 [Pyricularia oryzae]KAI6493373.1 hypothetical protein MCOR11_006225 [Pyricularia oryzae]KAI6542900.1 hypothetical protein MCOR16_000078 [Pyricularia oryzae]KAI6543034.1 hypothetical protein MCOR10_000189 [Pyricularia oryzae]KAI6543176.1 hypothetical protein MCOR05_003331 [Pyricularia oryzae]